MTDPYDDLASPLPHDRVDEMIGDADPPEAVREALHSRSVRLVDYDVRARQDFARGLPVGSVGLDDEIAGRLEKRAPELYAYQAEAIRRILAGESVVIEAPTAAGKTVAFLAPVVHRVARLGGRGTRALLVYPTKALMRDQLETIEKIAQSVEKSAKIMNGDISREDRKRMAADPPEILLVTFDLLHREMASHGPLHEMLKTVEILVADEAHFYNGLLGSNVHHVIRRMKRLCGKLQCIAASATLKNSQGFCSGLFGQEMRVVRGEGRLATIDFAMMAPAIPPKSRNDVRLLRHNLMVDVAKKSASGESRVLLFSNSRRGAEIVGVLARDAGLRAGIHRAGMDAKDLCKTEKDFREGTLDVLSCTPTLELGIDIGSVGTVVSEFVPTNRFLQRVGRAGRRKGRGFAVLALGSNPISQYYKNHPKAYDLDEWEPYIDPGNRGVVDIHTVAMAADRPLAPEEAEARNGAVERGIAGGLLAWEGREVVATDAGMRAARNHKIRGIGKEVRVLCGGEEIGDRNLPYAVGDLHPEALYLHNGLTYRIASLDLSSLTAEAIKMPGDLGRHTIPLVEKEVCAKKILSTRQFFGNEVKYCELEVTLRVNKYIERSYKTMGDVAKTRRLEKGIRHTFTTNAVGFWALHPEEEIPPGSPRHAEDGAYHAIEHVMVEASRMVIGVTHSDMDSTSCGNGLVYVYDKVEGGNGASRALYSRMDAVVNRSIGILDGCKCDADERGCIRCTFSHMCGKENEVLHKKGALESLRRFAGMPCGRGSSRPRHGSEPAAQ